MGRVISAAVSLDPLATTDDYTARVGAIPASATSKVEAALADVSATVRRFVKQDITRRVTVERFPVTTDTIRLTQKPVHEVTAVTIAGTSQELAYTIAEQTITLNVSATTLADTEHIDVEYDHGYDDTTDPLGVLEQVAAIVAVAAARAVGVDPLAAGVTSESVSGYSYNIGAVAAAGASGLLKGEQSTLRDLFGKPRAGQIHTSGIRYR